MICLKIWSPIWSPGAIWSPIWSPERLVVDLVVVDAVTLSKVHADFVKDVMDPLLSILEYYRHDELCLQF